MVLIEVWVRTYVYRDKCAYVFVSVCVYTVFKKTINSTDNHRLNHQSLRTQLKAENKRKDYITKR
jgi:hypothetical protein